MRLLIVEDDLSLSLTLEQALSPLFSLDTAATGKEALYLAGINLYDAIILDLGLPDATGIEVCEALRCAKNSTPILMLTGQQEVSQKVIALDAGVDDYLTKPFSYAELVARVRALIRRSYGNSLDTALVVEDLVLDLGSRTVSRAGQEIILRRKEYDLLEYLMRNQGKVVTRSMILEHVWNSTVNSFTNAIDVHVKYLRDQIDRAFPTRLIHTVYGMGYRIGGPSSATDNQTNPQRKGVVYSAGTYEAGTERRIGSPS